MSLAASAFFLSAGWTALVLARNLQLSAVTSQPDGEGNWVKFATSRRNYGVPPVGGALPSRTRAAESSLSPGAMPGVRRSSPGLIMALRLLTQVLDKQSFSRCGRFLPKPSRFFLVLKRATPSSVDPGRVATVKSMGSLPTRQRNGKWGTLNRRGGRLGRWLAFHGGLQ